MNLVKLFPMQKVLDDRIVKDKGLEGKDLLDKKILALQVELGELANEWRGFKFWSKDQEPRIYVNTCDHCIKYGMTSCCGCEGKLYKNRLLEEYVDCLHFILSIGLEWSFETIDFLKERKDWNNIGITYKDKTITAQFNNMFYFVSQLENDENFDEYISVVLTFVSLGEMLGFTWEHIEEAYISKNEINHARQENGY